MNTPTLHTGSKCLCDDLYAYALRLTKNDNRLAVELLLETLSQITHKASGYSSIDSFMADAYKVMRHAFLFSMRNDADIQELRRLCYHAHGTEYTPAEIIHAMSRLTPHQATVITLRLKGYSHSQIARATGHTTQWVNSNILKACQRLRNTLSN